MIKRFKLTYEVVAWSKTSKGETRLAAFRDIQDAINYAKDYMGGFSENECLGAGNWAARVVHV